MRSTLILIAVFVVLCYLIVSAVMPAGAAAPASARATFTPIAETTPAPTYAPQPIPTLDAYPAPAEPRRAPRKTAPERIRQSAPCHPRIGVRLVC